jgi:HlyD family secretion protein
VDFSTRSFALSVARASAIMAPRANEPQFRLQLGRLMSEAAAPKKPAPELFRKSALEKLSSPEQLDLLLQVTTPRSWLAIVPLCGLVVLATAWSVLGRIATKVHGQGILVAPGSLMEVTAPASGTLVELNVQVGEEVHPGQVVARIAQPELTEECRSAREELKELEAQQQALARSEDAAREQELKALAQERAALGEFLALAERRQTGLEELRKSSRGAPPRPGEASESAEQALYTVARDLANARGRLEQLTARETQVRRDQERDRQTRAARLREAARKAAFLEAKLERSTKVLCPFAGRVAELRASPRHAEVRGGSPLFVVVPAGQEAEDLQVTVYVSAAEGKKIHPGMRTEVSPAAVRREEYGYALGTVVSVAELPTTEQAMLAHLNDPGLVRNFVESAGIPLEVRVRLNRVPVAPSGYEWSSAQGPPTRLSVGMLCSAAFVVDEQRPISLLFPLLKKKLALE